MKNIEEKKLLILYTFYPLNILRISFFYLALSEDPAIVSDINENNSTRQFEKDANKENSILQETLQLTTQYFDKKFENLQHTLTKRISSAKRSILYDIKTRSEEINITISNLKIHRKSQGSRIELKEKLQINLPIETLPDFMKFEIELRVNEDKKKVFDGSSDINVF